MKSNYKIVSRETQRNLKIKLSLLNIDINMFGISTSRCVDTSLDFLNTMRHFSL